MIKSKEKIALGWIDGGTVMSGFAAYVSHLLLNRQDKVKEVVVSSGPYLSNNRNRMVELFLQTDCDWLFALDTDLKVNLESFDYLCESVDSETRPIVGGKYYLPFDNGMTLHPSAQSISQDPDAIYGQWLDESLVNGRTVVDNLHSVGLGYILIHRSVFEKVKKASQEINNPLPWFRDEWRNDAGTWISDDVYFFLQVQKLGINVALDPRATSGHLKIMTLDDDSYLTVRNNFQNAHAHHEHHEHRHERPSKNVSWWSRKKKQ